jgi:hypothetical protein
MSRQTAYLVLLSLLATAQAPGLAGCGAAGEGEPMNAKPEVPKPPSAQRPVIEESDIYRRVGNTLYVQNQQTGLNLVDVSNPARPSLVGRASATAGSAGELYVREGQAVVLLKQASQSCLCPDDQRTSPWELKTEIAIVDTTDRTRPQVAARWCLPGELVASRMVNAILYVVTNFDPQGTRIYSLDVSDPRNARMVKRLDFPDASKEIFVTSHAIFVAGRASAGYTETRVQMVSIAENGDLTLRGSATVPGQPQGRFHMDLWASTFRIVTYESWPTAGSRLSILDVSDPDNLKVIGSLTGIGHGEKLYATRFDGERAYVVTFRQTDPLWIVSLADPTRPTIVGELHVPGWSDYLFPRGKRLIAVGRGPNGNYVGVSLFDVSNPVAPRAVQQITLGDPDSTSEATLDHRAAALIETPGSPLLLAIPHSRLSYSSTCGLSEQLDLVEVTETGLQRRGSVQQQGTIRRAFLVWYSLYSLSDYELLAVDIADRDAPVVQSRLTLGHSVVANQAADDYCRSWDEQERHYMYEHDGHYNRWHFCAVGRGAAGPPPLSLVVLGLGYLVARLRRRSPR